MKKTLTNRERIIATLHKQETDRPCWSPLIDPYFISSLPRQNIHMSGIEAMRYIGIDIMERHVCNPRVRMRNVNVERQQSTDGKKWRTNFTTPVGNVYEESICSGETNFVTKHMIETIEDAKIFQYIKENTFFVDNIKAFREKEQYIGEDGIAVPSVPATPIQWLLQYAAGVENTVYLMADYPEEMNEVLQIMHECNKREIQVLCEYPAELLIAYEDTSSSVMSRQMFQEYSQPQINEYAKIFHEHDKIYITHMCGRLAAFAEIIGEGTQDGIDSVCPLDTGDMDIWEARKIWGKDKILIGGIEPAALVRMSQEQTIACVKEIMTKMKGEKGFILSTGDAVAYGTPIENLMAITNYIRSC